MLGLFKNLFASTDKAKLKEAIQAGAVLVDVRTVAEYNSGSVKGAINIPLDNLQSQMSKLKTDKCIVVFCRSGNRSAQAQRMLTNNGFQNVINGATWQSVNQAVLEG